MTVNEALKSTQGRGAGIMNKASAKYAQEQILPEEEILAAVVANISARGERFPGVVVLTDQRVMAVCGLPGIKRMISCDIDTMEPCVEAPSAITYKAIFSTKETAFSMSVDPEVGEKFSRCIAVINGEEEAFDAVEVNLGNSIFNPTLVRNKIRARQAKKKEREKRAAEMEAIRARKEALRKERVDGIELGSDGESTQDLADRLARQLDEARTVGRVDDNSPQAIAARLAAELAAEEAQKNAES